jgi:2,3-dihydroxy-p-cumate/2,3-dihydroxybenzoate 3,4-dioxygenase
MIRLGDIGYTRLGTGDLEAATRFACDVLGLQLAREDGGARYFRSDARDHTLVYFDGDPGDHTLGFELRSVDALEVAAATLSDAGLSIRWGNADDCEKRQLGSFVAFRDLTGNAIELVVRAQCADTRAFVPGRAVGITGFSHVGLCSTDPVRDERFWVDMLGARVSDRIGDAALLRIDEVHHKIALFQSKRPGIQHVNHQVADVDDLMRSWYFLRRQGVRIVFGPGRHPTSGAVFLYFEGPDGMVFEYSTGVRTIAPEEEASHRPRQFPSTADSFCMWGAIPDIAEFGSAMKPAA